MPPIANYTTTVPVDRSVRQVVDMLFAHGATNVNRLEEAGKGVVGLQFGIETEYGWTPYRLPVRVDGVLAAMIADKTIPRGKSLTREHAARVAWRISYDWLRAQLALIESGMSTLPEVMFPYALVTGQDTAFEMFQQKQLER